MVSSWAELNAQCRRYEPPRKVDINVALRDAGVSFYDRRRVPEIYRRLLRKKEIYDGLSIRELEQLCRDRNISLRHMPSIPPGPISHPWVQEGFQRLHARLVEALEKPEIATTFHRFLDLEKGHRLRIYKAHYGLTQMDTLPAIAQTSHMVRKEALSIYFDRNFELNVRTSHPSIPASFHGPESLESPTSTKTFPTSQKLLSAPPSYANRITRLTICRWNKEEPTFKADRGIWKVDLGAVEEKRVCWIPEFVEYMYEEKGEKKEMKNIEEATSRLRHAVGSIAKNDGKLRGEDVRSLARALNN